MSLSVVKPVVWSPNGPPRHLKRAVVVYMDYSGSSPSPVISGFSCSERLFLF
jgi:hypothetical protein